MKKSIFNLICGFVLSTILMSQAFAVDVYVTKYGKKYHAQDAKILKDKEVTKMTQEEAEELGYTPSKNFIRATEKTTNGE